MAPQLGARPPPDQRFDRVGLGAISGRYGRWKKGRRILRYTLILAMLFMGAIGGVLVSKSYYKHAPIQPSQTSNNLNTAQTINGHASVIDGDTIKIGDTRIRFHGIDAPESEQSCSVLGETYACGQQASEALTNVIANNTVSCEQKDLDRYNRIVAVCRTGGHNLKHCVLLDDKPRKRVRRVKGHWSGCTHKEEHVSRAKLGGHTHTRRTGTPVKLQTCNWRCSRQ